MTLSLQVKCLKQVMFNTGTFLKPGMVYECRKRQTSNDGKTTQILEVLTEKEPLIIALDHQGRWQNDELFQECFHLI